jgi:hypothetical protein
MLSSRRRFLGVVAGGTLVAAGVGSASPALAAPAATGTVERLKQSIRIEKLEAKAAGIEPDWAAIAAWKDQIRVERLQARAAKLNRIQDRAAANPKFQRKLQNQLSDLDRKAAALASRLG